MEARQRRAAERSRSVEPVATHIACDAADAPAGDAGGHDDGTALKGNPNDVGKGGRYLDGDLGNVLLLLVLYVLQGLPMGLAGVVPMMLKERGVSMSDIGSFTITSLPYSVKILWAPIVDAVFSKQFGRRKSWLIPFQFLIALILLGMPMGELVDAKDVGTLTSVFLLLYFCCATQDIAVDGWALSMLSTKNKGYASTCNAAGQVCGFFLSFTGFMVLEDYKVMDLTAFSRCCGVAFLVTTVGVWLFKKEAVDEDVEDLKESYRGMVAILYRPAVRKLALCIVFAKIPFVVTATAPLKLQEGGVSKETLAFISTAVMPLTIAAPAMIASRTASDTPLSVFSQSYVPRIAGAGVAIYLAHHALSGGSTSGWFYVALVAWQVLEALLSTFMFASQMALFARVSDPTIGGTYMTFLNTMANLAALLPTTLALKACDWLTIGGVDGFYYVSMGAAAFGSVWYCCYGRAAFAEIDRLPLPEWRLPSSRSD